MAVRVCDELQHGQPGRAAGRGCDAGERSADSVGPSENAGVFGFAHQRTTSPAIFTVRWDIERNALSATSQRSIEWAIL